MITKILNTVSTTLGGAVIPTKKRRKKRRKRVRRFSKRVKRRVSRYAYR